MYFLKTITRETLLGVGMSFIAFFICSTTYTPNANCTELGFIDKTIDSGLSHLPSPSYGLSWGDFNGDGMIDLHIRNHGNTPSLYENSGDGTFADVTSEAGLDFSDDFHGAAWGDFDNDGDSDLYQAVGAYHGTIAKTNYLFENEGDVLFTDVAGSAGIQDALGRGRTPVWFDYNNDGLLDLFVANQQLDDAPSVLFRNEGDGSFTDVTEDAELAGIECAVGTHVADVNGDGNVDILLSNYGGILLYLNNADGTFTDFTAESGLSSIKMVHDLALGDADNDGDMDIFVARGASGGSDVYETTTDELKYRLNIKDIEKGFDLESTDSQTLQFDLYWEQQQINPYCVYIGAGTYHPATMPFSLDATYTPNQGEPVRTFDGIYVWFDQSDERWHIRYFRKEDSTTFVFGGIISTAGTFGEVVPVGLEIDATNYRNKLLRNSGTAQFTDVTYGAGLDQDFGNAMSAVFMDADNDGDLDLYVVYTGGITNEPNKLYENNGRGCFADIAEAAGAQAQVEGRGESVAVADYNNDGFVDIAVLNGAGESPFGLGQRVLLENIATDNNWIQLELTGTISNRDGVGAVVSLAAGPLNLTRQQTGGVHRVSQNSQILQFGLGDEIMVDSVTIYWPSGIVQQLFNIAVNQRLVVKEPIVSLSLTPDKSVIGIGETLGIQVTATNYTNEDQSFLFASNVTLPNGSTNPSPPDALFGPKWINLSPYETRTRYISHDIPGSAPEGAYTYNGFIGKAPWNVWNESHFDFTVTP
ncbi:MAG: CRTAC1 family protein [Proteobacteria bacterium]|nr:CRTAC1 family protein [Pseudomonadota bacterium]